MLIIVTQDDIDSGIKCGEDCCALAIAINRSTGLLCRVTPGTVVFTTVPHSETSLPAKAFDFVRDFDAGEQVYPFSFDLQVPECVLKSMKPISSTLAVAQTIVQLPLP